jgi:hypothetical protein
MCVGCGVGEIKQCKQTKGNPEGKTRQQQPQSDKQNMVTKRCEFCAKNLSIKVPQIFEHDKAAVPSRKQRRQSIPEN